MYKLYKRKIKNKEKIKFNTLLFFNNQYIKQTIKLDEIKYKKGINIYSILKLKLLQKNKYKTKVLTEQNKNTLKK